MASPIIQLFALQEVDTRLRGLTSGIDELEKAADEIARQAEETRSRVDARRQEAGDLDRRRREIEARLRDEEEKTKTRRMRMQRIRNDRELAALRHEIDLGKESSSLLEEELLKIFEILEVKTAEIGGLDEELRAHQERLDERRLELEMKREELRERLEATRAERAKIAADLDPDLIARYDVLRSRRAGVAVVEIRQGDCSGCGLRLPPQLLTQLHRNQDLIPCPSCHRILYTSIVRPDPAPSSS